MKRYRVRVTEEAEADLLDIHRYVLRNDSRQQADKLLEALESCCMNLAKIPERGHVPPELDRLGISVFREVHYKPYRIIYQVIGQDAFIHGVLDGRRDMQTLLERRLLRQM